MAGLFDDLTASGVPSQPAATTSAPTRGLFDDLTATTAPKAAEPAQPQRQGSGITALTGGFVDGLPIVGPALKEGAQRGAALIRSGWNGTSYDHELENVRGFDRASTTQNPGLTTTGNVAGAVAGTVPMVAAAPAAFGAGAGPLAIRSGYSALTGGAIGGLDSAARGQDPVVGGALGLATGGIAPPVAAGVGKLVGAVASRISPAAAAPTSQDLKSGARAAYDAADGAGVRIRPEAFSDALADIAHGVREAGFNAKLYPKAAAALEELRNALGSAPTLKDVELLRRVVGGAAGSIEPAERRVAKIMMDKLDDFTGGLRPEHLVSGDADVATRALGEARDLWGRAKRAEVVDTAVEKAERRAASTGSGGNVENATRQNIRAILDNPKKVRGFSEEERAAMEQIVRGTPGQNALRLIGKLAPTGIVSGGMGSAMGASIGSMLGGPTGAGIGAVALPALGTMAKRSADRGTAAGVNRLGEMVRNGGELPVSQLGLLAQDKAEQISRLGLSATPLFANQRR